MPIASSPQIHQAGPLSEMCSVQKPSIRMPSPR